MAKQATHRRYKQSGGWYGGNISRAEQCFAKTRAIPLMKHNGEHAAALLLCWFFPVLLPLFSRCFFLLCWCRWVADAVYPDMLDVHIPIHQNKAGAFASFDGAVCL